MNIFKRTWVVSVGLFISVALALTACGGGGGGGSSAPASSAKAITAYSLAGVAGTINEANKTIAVTMPSGTNVTALVATFTTTGASIAVGATAQVSGSTANDFTNPVTYTVTAADASTVNYTVTVTVALSSAKAITAYSLAGVTGVINETNKIIAVTMPSGTNVTALVATFTTTGASIAVGASAQVSGSTANDFTNPVIYTVTAADASTVNYTVTVTVASNSAKAITAYSLAGVTGTINEGNKTIAVTMPSGTNVTALVATFTTTGASIAVGASAQVSGSTANDFSNPVVYTVTAADASTVNYTVTVTVALGSAKAITAYSLAGVAGIIDETNKTIAVTMPSGTSVTALVATFTTTGASVAVGASAQVSGSTANDFTNPVTYTVTAADASTVSYTVTVTVTPIVSIPAGSNPSAVAVTPDGTHALVTNSASPGTVTVIALSSKSIVATITVGTYPGGIAISPDGSQAVVTNGASSNNVSVVNLSNNTVTKTISPACVATTLYDIAYTPDGTKAVMGDLSSGCTQSGLDVIDIATGTISFINLNPYNGPFGVAVTPDGASALATNGILGSSIRRINLSNSAVTTITATSASFGVAVTPDGSAALVTSGEGDTVKRISLATNTVTATIPYASNQNTHNIAITPDGSKAVVVGDFDTALISLATNSVLVIYPVGGGNVAITPDGKTALVTTYASGGTLNMITLP